jgi:hypothetical protein
MGYDVTFHPISAQELDRYVLDVIRDPRLAADRAETISINPAVGKYVAEDYAVYPKWLGSGHTVSETIGYSAASIAGFLHPY